MTRHDWRGKPYREHEDAAANSYREARTRARALKPQSWAHYQKLAVEHGLPTQPQTLWPEQWERGGKFAGFIGAGVGHDVVEERGLLSASEIRGQLQIGHATWKLLTDGLRPAAHVSHKTYFSVEAVKKHMTERLSLVVRSDARVALQKALDALTSASSS
jgi:hypothetical protein